jgi:hypothetical protein
MEGQSWHRLPTYAPNGIQFSGPFTSGPSIDCFTSNLFIVPMALYSTHGESLPTQKCQHTSPASAGINGNIFGHCMAHHADDW